ncbi:DUF6221 family protein [Nocardia otitidiscaviarum]|uniref:DUF6221 family protein n=1 Tax=Nocardia otitidiscaviarum TaxID=1823 RepID=UPI000AB3429E|nr:DUF6221 family protein [Nocardia otitidiscaviarum]
MTIEEFIEARLAEDEAHAQAATSGKWEWTEDRDLAVAGEWAPCTFGCRGNSAHQHQDFEFVVTAVGHEEPRVEVSDADADHIARHDPARVLRQCAALRAIVGELADEADGLDAQVDGEFRVSARDLEKEPLVGDLIRRHVAAIWSTHADYDPSWAVDEGGSTT